MHHQIVLSLGLLFLLFGCANGLIALFERLIINCSVANLIYKQYVLQDYPPSTFCIGRLNKTHHFGCHNARGSAQMGVPYLVTRSKSVGEIGKDIEKSSTPLVLLVDIFYFEWIDNFRSNYRNWAGNIAGVIFYREKGTTNQSASKQYKSYSHDSTCPSSTYGSLEKASALRHCKVEWVSSDNPFLNFANIEWPFPMFHVENQTLVDNLVSCAKFDGKYDANDCMIQLKLKMYGAINANRCLNRNYPIMDGLRYRSTSHCSNIQVRNMISPLIPVSGLTKEGRSTIVLTARLDALTAFESFAPASNSVYSALIVLFATARLLNIKRDNNPSPNELNNVLYALFDGESLGYIGSTTWIYRTNGTKSNGNTSEFEEHFNLSKIAYVLELSQLISKGGQFWVHRGNQSDDKTNKFVDNLVGKGMKKADTSELPPSTAKVFKMFDPNISAVLITGYNLQYEDPFFHSIFDKADNSSVKNLASLAKNLAEFLSSQLGTSGLNDESSNEAFVNKLAECFFQHTTSCDLFSGPLNLTLTNVPFDYTTPVRAAAVKILDTSVVKHTFRTTRFNIVRQALLRVFKRVNVHFKHDCEWKDRPYKALQKIVSSNESNNMCSFVQVDTKEVHSPYFDYMEADKATRQHLIDFFHTNPDFEFSSVVETFYEANKQPSILIFKRPSTSYQIMVVVIGFVVLFVSFALTCMCNKRSLFVQPNEKADAPMKNGSVPAQGSLKNGSQASINSKK